MANKGIFIGVIVVLAIVVLGLVGYFVILPSINQNASSAANPSGSQSSSSATTPDFSGGITAAVFQVFPAGTQITQGSVGAETNTFNKNDQVTISGNSTVSKQVVLTLKIFDTNGNDAGVAWHGSQITIRSGQFGFGTISIPQTSGDYVLKIYLDNYESKSMPFHVL